MTVQFRETCPPEPVGIYLFKVNNRNSRARWEICSKLTIKTPEQRQWRRSGVFIVNFEHISHLGLVFLLLTCTCSPKIMFLHVKGGSPFNECESHDSKIRSLSMRSISYCTRPHVFG